MEILRLLFQFMPYREFFETHKDLLFTLIKDYYINFYSKDSSTINLSIQGDIEPGVLERIKQEGFSVESVDFKYKQVHFVKKL